MKRREINGHWDFHGMFIGNLMYKFASYCGLVPRIDQSGETTHYGRITKNGPSLLRFFLVLAAHTLIKMSPTYRRKYMRIVKRRNKYIAIVAIARSMATTIYSMLKNNTVFSEDYSELHGRKIKRMESNASRVKPASNEDVLWRSLTVICNIYI